MTAEYIRSVLGIFGKSPFRPLHTHAETSGKAVKKVSEALIAYCEGDYEKVNVLVEEISELEHDADKIKQSIRKALTGSIMLPVNVNDLLLFLKPQDYIADNAQLTAYWLSIRQCDIPDDVKEGLIGLMGTVMKTIDKYEILVDTLADLLELSFSKRGTDEALALVDEVSMLEHIADVADTHAKTIIFKHESELGGAGVYHLIELVNKISDIADSADSAADRLRSMLYRR